MMFAKGTDPKYVEKRLREWEDGQEPSSTQSRADQIRAEIARLQQELASLPNGAAQPEDAEAEAAFAQFTQGGRSLFTQKSAEQVAREMGLMDVFNYSPSGKFSFSPQAAQKNEQLRRWFMSQYAVQKNRMEKAAQEKKIKQFEEDTLRTTNPTEYARQQQLAQKAQQDRINMVAQSHLDRFQQNPDYQIPPMYRKMLEEQGKLTPAGQSSNIQTPNMPPAWN